MAIVLSDDFTGTNGTLLRSRPGWSLLSNSYTVNQDDITLNGNGNATAPGGVGANQICVIGTDCGTLDHSLTVKPGFATAQIPFYLGMRVNTINPLTWVRITVDNGSISINRQVNGVQNSLSRSYTYSAGTKLRFTIVGDTLTPTVIAPNGTETNLATVDVSSVPASSLAGISNIGVSRWYIDEISFSNNLADAVTNTAGFFSLI